MVRFAAELTSIRTLVEELQARVGGIAQECERGAQEDLGRVLFEAERALRAAAKQVARAERLVAEPGPTGRRS
jgi:hypothetical protein